MKRSNKIKYLSIIINTKLQYSHTPQKIQVSKIAQPSIIINQDIAASSKSMTNRQNNDGYANQFKKPLDKTKYYTWPCDKGYKCPYRKADDDGTIIKNYCKFIHYPYDLCPDKEDCEFFETQDCVWKHTTKPKPAAPAPVPEIKASVPVTQIIQSPDEFPAIGGKSPHKPNPAALKPKNINKAPEPPTIKEPTPPISNLQNIYKNTHANNFKNIESQNGQNINSNLANQKKTQNPKNNNPESNSYVTVQINAQTTDVKKQGQRCQILLNKVEEKGENQKKPEQFKQTYKNPSEIPKSHIQKSSLFGECPLINHPKQQMAHQGWSQVQLYKTKTGNHQASQIQNHQVKFLNSYTLRERETQITKEIERLTKEVLKYNIEKSQMQSGDYENNIRLAQILKLSNDLRQIPKQSLKNQPKIIYQNESVNQNGMQSRKNSETGNSQDSNPFRNEQTQFTSTGQQIITVNSIQKSPVKNKNESNLQNQRTINDIQESSGNQPQNAEQKNEKNTGNKRIFLSLEQLSELSIDKKNPTLSQHLLTVFFDFLAENDFIEFKLQVNNKKFQIVQKYYEEGKKKNKHFSLYEVEVLEQSHFEQLCETISKYSYTVKGQNQQSQEGPEKTIKQFFQHLFKYLQFYFNKIKKEFKDRTLESLDLFYKTVVLPEDLLPANSPSVSIQDPNHFKGPIYVGGMRSICMRFFSKIFLLFLENDYYAIMKLKESKISKGPVFDPKNITKFMQEKHEQTVKRLTGHKFNKEKIECNKKKRPIDRQLIGSEVKNKLISQMMIRSHFLMDEIMLGQKDTLLSWQSMKEYLELQTHEKVYSDSTPETEVDQGEVEIIKVIAKGQIWIEKSDRKRYNQKEKNRFSFLDSYFMDYSVDQAFTQIHNEFIINKTIRIGYESFVTLLSDGKYVIEEPIDEQKSQQYQDSISSKLKQKNAKTINPPFHQTQIFFYAKANTGLYECPLELIAEDAFFKNKILDFTQESPYLVYSNKQHGFYGSDFVNNFQMRIYRSGGIVEFINARSQQQCKRFLGYLLDIIERIIHSKEQSSEETESSKFLLMAKIDNSAELTSIEKSVFGLSYEMQPKEQYLVQAKSTININLFQSISVLTWNLKRIFESDLIHRQIPYSLRVTNIINDLKTMQADFVCLQEVKDFKKQIFEELCAGNEPLYYMPFHEEIDDYETLILTRFPAQYRTVKIASQKWACCEFEISSWTPESDTTMKKDKKDESQQTKSVKSESRVKQVKHLSVLLMSVHLKCTQTDSEQNFLASTKKRQAQLQNLERFFKANEYPSQKKYDIVIMAGDFNIDDEPAEYKEDGEQLHLCDHNEKYLKYPPYFDLQAQLQPQTLSTFKTYLHKGQMQNGKYKLGGSRLDRILVRGHSMRNVKKIITHLRKFSLVGDYSVRSKENASEVNYDKFTRSPSDHFGVYMEIPFNI